MNKKILTIFPLLFLVCSCSNTSGNTTTPIVNELLDNVDVDDFDYFHHIGRYDLNNNKVIYTYSSSGFALNIKVTEEINSLSIQYSSSISGIDINKNKEQFIYIYVDDTASKINISGTGELIIFNNLPVGDHKIKVIKANETFTTFEVSSLKIVGAKYSKYKNDLKRLEIYGDSTSCGYGNLCEHYNSNNDNWHGFTLEEEDSEYAYGPLLGKKLNYETSVVGYSGITISMGNNPTMLDRYDTVNNKKWDMQKYIPDLVIIGLGINDNTIFTTQIAASDKENAMAKYRLDYISLMEKINENAPEAKIIVLYDNMIEMDAALITMMENAVETINGNIGEDIAYIYQSTGGRHGGDGHPTKDNQQATADGLFTFINENNLI